MKQITSIIVVVLCIFATFGVTYAVVNAVKDQEITDLKTQYELDKSNLNNTIYYLDYQLNGYKNLTNQLYGDENDRIRFIGTWNATVNWSTENITSYRFYEDGYFGSNLHYAIMFNWELIGSKLVILGGGAYTSPFLIYDYSFSNNDATLTLTDVESGDIGEFTKQ